MGNRNRKRRYLRSSLELSDLSFFTIPVSVSEFAA